MFNAFNQQKTENILAPGLGKFFET